MKIEITKENALKAYDSSNNDGKKLLEDLFGSDLFKPQDICDRVKTFEDALAIRGIENLDSDTLQLLSYKGSNNYMLGALALIKLEIIIEVLNEKWIPNWQDHNEAKWHVWSRFGSLGWSSNGYDNCHAGSDVGSRLTLRNKKLTEYVGTQFAPLYNQLFTK